MTALPDYTTQTRVTICTPIQHTVVNGVITKVQKVKLLTKGNYQNLSVCGVNIKNEVKKTLFDENGEAWFGSFVPVGIWLEFTRVDHELPDMRVIFTGDTLEI